ncbi:hypothetical protein H5410_053576 [Solanum commersonii]|uniref:Uncharacterized protein n=1 Tax=Solanum commersonii TaxID=4109 RepID=A0A9J5X6A4_SOLCO|nr:hypothetical protein H5410_053576 [Solanum commersonii]
MKLWIVPLKVPATFSTVSSPSSGLTISLSILLKAEGEIEKVKDLEFSIVYALRW